MNTSSEYRYYNLSYYNNSNGNQPIVISKSLDVPFLQNPSEWNCLVRNFTIPNINTPFFEFKDGQYIMSLDYNGNTYSTPIVYEQVTIPSSSFRGVYTIGAFVQMVNTTIQTLFTMFAITHGPLPTSDIPVCSYNCETKLINMSFNKNYFATDGSVATPIYLRFNQILLSFFNSIPCKYMTISDTYRFEVIDLGNNVGATYIDMKQEAVNFATMSNFNGIIIKSNIPTQNQFSSSSIQENILSDFYPTDFSIDNFYNNIVYNTVFPYRLTNLRSSSPLYQIELRIYRVSNDGSTNLMYLLPGQTATVNLMFIKK